MFFTELETSRLWLKNIEIEDREFIFKQFSNKTVNQYLYDAAPLIIAEEADEIIGFYLKEEPRNRHRWIITAKENGEKLGTCGFHCWNVNDGTVEMGYDLFGDFWGHGYMRESIKEIIDFAINKMKIKRIIACIYIENHKSINVVTHFGFQQIGMKNEVFNNTEYPHFIFALDVIEKDFETVK
jgi:[ribosomal protein S5]-alanine N-acetyltransferase